MEAVAVRGEVSGVGRRASNRLITAIEFAILESFFVSKTWWGFRLVTL